MHVDTLYDPFAVHQDGNDPLTGNWDVGGFDIVNVNDFGAGTAVPARRIESLDSSAAQLRLTHTAGSVYSDFKVDGSNIFTMSIAGTERIWVDENGYFGVGGNPQADTPFYVRADLASDMNLIYANFGTGLIAQTFQSQVQTAGGVIANLDFNAKDSNGNIGAYSRIQMISQTITDGSEDGSIAFINRVGGSFDEVMRIRADKVGLKTNDPQALFHIEAAAADAQNLRIDGETNPFVIGTDDLVFNVVTRQINDSGSEVSDFPDEIIFNEQKSILNAAFKGDSQKLHESGIFGSYTEYTFSQPRTNEGFIINSWTGPGTSRSMDMIASYNKYTFSTRLQTDTGFGAAKTFTFNLIGGKFEFSGVSQIYETEGSLICNIIGGEFRGALGTLSVAGDPEINFYGGKFIANGGTAGTTTSYGGYFSATNSDTNWAAYFADGNVYAENALTTLGIITAPNFVSNVAIGTSPFACTSTTLNTNLNADLWDGYQFADYLDQAVKTTSNPTFANIEINGDLNHDGTNAGFYGTAPVSQRLKADYNNWAAVSDVVDALVALGLFDQA